jgi:hypothetical protein
LSWFVVAALFAGVFAVPSLVDWMRASRVPLSDGRGADRARLPVEWDPHLDWER